jgi:phosphate starvation-inducible protein PhoH and related proteins
MPNSTQNTPPLVITFDSNTLLPELCGHHDTHLQLIEDRLGVQLVAKGNQLAIMGPPDASAKAHTALTELYQLLKNGHSLSPAQVDATLRLTAGLLDPTELRAAHGGTLPGAAGAPGGGAGGGVQVNTPNKKILPRTVTQSRYLKALQHTTLVFGLGPAGTGKTYLACAMAVQLLVSKKVEKLILTRPVVEAGERLGFLPGTFEEKIDPYLRPLFDALDDTMGRDKWQKMRENGQIEIAPLAYMRGRTLEKAVLLLDEAQNTTPVQMKMFLTRLGEGSRMFVTGDPTQCDLPPVRTRGGTWVKAEHGLNEAVKILDGLRDIDVVRFGEADVVRHPLVSTIVQAYTERDRQLNFTLAE